MITFSGTNICGGYWTFLDVIQPNTDINQFTFSNIDSSQDQIYALSINWINPLTGSVQLEILPNGVSIS